MALLKGSANFNYLHKWIPTTFVIVLNASQQPLLFPCIIISYISIIDKQIGDSFTHRETSTKERSPMASPCPARQASKRGTIKWRHGGKCSRLKSGCRKLTLVTNNEKDTCFWLSWQRLITIITNCLSFCVV